MKQISVSEFRRNLKNTVKLFKRRILKLLTEERFFSSSKVPNQIKKMLLTH